LKWSIDKNKHSPGLALLWHNSVWHNSFGMTRSRTAHITRFLLTLLLLAPLLQAQPPASTVAFEQTFPGSDPAHYLISITSDCHATYESNGKLTPQSEGDDSFHLGFKASAPTCSKVFDLAKQAHYFEREIDSKKKNLASTGIKVLSYKDGQKSTKSTYNYSTIVSVQELTEIFQGLGATLEFGRRLEYDHHYQKLALDDEMKRMQESETSRGLQDVSAIEAILQQIVDDPSVIQVVRVRAQRLLAAAK
jgi:hypothetical protein